MTDRGSSSTLQEGSGLRASRSSNVRLGAGRDYQQRLARSLAPSSSSRTASVHSTASYANPKMLPSHPSTLPHFYASEASVSGDDSEQDGNDPEDRSLQSSERKKREEARQRRRAKQQGSVNSATSSRAGPGENQSGSPIKWRTVGGAHDSKAFGAGSRDELMERGGMLEGLGFQVGGLAGTDYQVLVDEAAFQAHPPRRESATTYSSSLGSAVPSPSQTISSFPSRPRRRSRQMSEASYNDEELQATPRITVEEFHDDSETSRVRFDPSSQEPERERRPRTRPTSTSVQLESDHIVFPDTLPPSIPRVPTPQAQIAPASHPSPTSPSHFARRRAPSVASSHHGIGSYGSSNGSIASQSSLQLTLDDPIPVSPHFKSPSGRSTRSRGRSNSSNSVEDAPASIDLEFKPNSRSARQARRPTGPTTIVGEMLARQNPDRLYFPSPSPRRPGSTASSERSPPLSIVSSVFPSRPRPSSQYTGAASPATSASPRLPFPPPPSSSKSTPSLVFPPPPIPSSPPRYGRSRYGQRPPPSPRSNLPNSPSFASTLSSMSAQSVEQPVFPTLGAQLAADGLVRSGIAPRRVSGTPWERSAEERATQGDELDRMMAAQSRSVSGDVVGGGGDATEAKVREREKERKRRNIVNELMRTKTSDSLVADGELDSFQRELLARDTVKKSLGAKLLSEEASRAGSDASGGEEDAESTGITPSTSASSDISTLPPFPDVPTHTYRLPNSTSYPSTADDPDHVEVVLSSASSAAVSPITPTFSYSYHPTTPSANPLKRSNRESLASSTSDQSHYEDAQEEPSSRTSEDAGTRTEPRLELSKQQTSLWVLDTLASTGADTANRPLSDIGETEEPEEVLRESAPVPPPAPAPEPVVPSLSPVASFHARSPSMTAVQRCDSPTLSQGSRSTASSAPVSYTAPKRHPTASAVPLKTKTKSTFGKKIGALFGGGSTSYNAAALGLRGSGVSSRDVANLHRPSNQALDRRSRQESSEMSFTRGSSESHTRSHSHSSSSYSTFNPIPTTPSSFSNATFPTSNLVASSTSDLAPRGGGGGGGHNPSNTEANKLAQLLSKFEQEDKARFKGIAASRLPSNKVNPQQNVVVV